MRWLNLFVLIIFVSGGFAYAGADRDEILQAIQECAGYAANTLLDEQGKSRCDYNMTEGRWYDYEPPWHTGQIIYALVEAYRVSGNTAYLDAARRAGDWWVGLEIRHHPKLTGMLNAIHGDHAGEVIVFATVSDGTAGLFRLYEATGDKRYADVPTGAGEWMRQHMYVPEHGVFYDNVDPETGEVIRENSPFWPDKADQTLYDVARPNNEGSLYKDMYEYTREEKYRALFIELCESLVEKQGPEGLWMDFMPNDKAKGTFHPRFNLWYAESLLEGYDLTGDARYLEAASKTARLYARFQKNDGTIYYENNLDGTSNESSVCGSAVAFAGIVWLRLFQYGAGDEFVEHIDKSVSFLLKNRFAADHPDPNLAGAVLNTRTRHRKGKIWLVNRDVGTSFGIRFLCDYLNFLNNPEE